MRSVRLKPELEQKLQRVSRMQGKTASRVIQEAVEEHCNNALISVESLDISLAPWIGSLDGGKSDARDIKKAFAEGLEEKKRSGRL